jgi:Skp family chaperone for outer membrane proteins
MVSADTDETGNREDPIMSENKTSDDVRQVLEEDREKLQKMSKKIEEKEKKLSEEERLRDTIAAPTDVSKEPHYPGLG